MNTSIIPLSLIKFAACAFVEVAFFGKISIHVSAEFCQKTPAVRLALFI